VYEQMLVVIPETGATTNSGPPSMYHWVSIR